MSLILGAYPIEPDDPGQRRRLFELLGASGLYGGLELPYYSTGGVRWPEGAPRDWRVVVTAIPGTMHRMSADPAFGLASEDAEGRARAIDFAAGIRDYVAAVAAAGPLQVAVELHSAPPSPRKSRCAGRVADSACRVGLVRREARHRALRRAATLLDTREGLPRTR